MVLKNIIILMIVKFSLATLAIRLFAFFVGRYHRLRLVGQVALLRLVPKLHNHADDVVDDADADGITLRRHHLTFLRWLGDILPQDILPQRQFAPRTFCPKTFCPRLPQILEG